MPVIVRTVLIVLLLWLAGDAAAAERWGSFNGHTPSGDAVSLVVSSRSASATQAGVEDLAGQVLTVSGGEWLPEVCHRRTTAPELIWCDGNARSVLHGATYQQSESEGGPRTEDSTRQRWKCIKGCDGQAPASLLYER